MFRRSCFLALTAIVLISLCGIAQGQARKGGKKRIAVIQFEAPGEYAGTPVPSGIADMITTTLVKSGRFDVVERMQLDKILQEQKLGTNGVLDPSTAPKLGKVLGVDYLLGGKITEFGIKEKKGGGIGVLGGLLGVDVKKSTARVALDMRLIECDTGKILMADTGVGEEKESGIALAASDLRHFAIATRFDTKEWAESRIGKACRKAVDAVVGKVTGFFPVECVVLAVIDSSGRKCAILDMGNFAGVQVGDEYQIFHEEITKDDSGEVIWADKKQVGIAKVLEVQNERCKAELTAGASAVQKGDKAIPVKALVP